VQQYEARGDIFMILSSYEPKRVLHHFEALSQIPRGSGNEKGVSDYVAAFAKGLNLKFVQDSLHSLVIYKPATPGYEGQAPVILQGHLDMVCEKNAGTIHDFMTDPLKLYVEGDYLHAKGTTLGADNGIAVAMCMALLEATDLPHPPLEVVLTVEEETGMDGAWGLDANLLKGRSMLNLDSSTEGVFIAGSAAAATVEYMLPATWEAPNQFTEAYTISVKGLQGGHSGGDVKLERGNANRILGIQLSAISEEVEVRVVSTSGGMKVNAIPREAEAVIAIKPCCNEQITTDFEKCAESLRSAFRVADPGLEMKFTPAQPVKRVLSSQCNKNFIASLLLLPNGVQCMSRDIDDLVAASCNTGVLETNDEMIKITCMPRGATDDHVGRMEAQISALAQLSGAETRFSQRGAAWAFNPDSKLLAKLAEIYKHMYDEPTITASHGGLEGGIFIEKLPGLDVLSFGPDIHDLHTPDERLSISSTARTWAFLCAALSEMK